MQDKNQSKIQYLKYSKQHYLKVINILDLMIKIFIGLGLASLFICFYNFYIGIGAMCFCIFGIPMFDKMLDNNVYMLVKYYPSKKLISLLKN